MSTMQIDRGVVQQALEALEAMNPYPASREDQRAGALTALRSALAQTRGEAGCHPPLQAEPVQEPVAKVELMTTGGNAGLATRIVEIDDHLRERLRPGQLLYTTPPQRQPLSLTDLQEALVLTNLVDRDAIDDSEEYDEGSTLAQIDELHRIIERAHGIGEQS